jgi:SAM-dependent methyltransferase
MERIDPLSERPSIVAEHKHRYQIAKSVAFGDVLDCACGLGYGSEIILQQPAVKKYTGVDISSETIAIASERYKNPSVTFVTADATKLPFPDSTFDTVISLETFEHLKSPESIVREFNRVLKPGGVLIASAPTIEHDEFCENTFGKNPYHHYRFTQKNLVEILNIVGSNKIYLARIIAAAELLPIGEHQTITYRQCQLPPLGSYIGIARKGGTPPNILAEATSLLCLVEVESEITKAYDRIVADRDTTIVGYKIAEIELRKALKTAEEMAVDRLEAVNAYAKSDAELRLAFSKAEEMIRERDSVINDLKALLNSSRTNG